MNMNQSKVNQILGLFSILNGIELSLARNSDCGIFDPEYVQFDCSFTFDDRYDTWYCDLTSIKMRLCRDMLTGSDSRYPQNAFGGHWPTMQTIWDDSCKYSDFCEVVRFARNAIKSGGTKNMKAASHKIEVEMPDYLGFEVIDN